MAISDKSSKKKLIKLIVLLELIIPIVIGYAERSVAIPLEPILDQLGKRAVERLFRVESTEQPPSNPQVNNSENQQESTSTYPPNQLRPTLPTTTTQPNYPSYPPTYPINQPLY